MTRNLRFSEPTEHHQCSPDATPLATRSPTPFPSPVFDEELIAFTFYSSPASSSSSLHVRHARESCARRIDDLPNSASRHYHLRTCTSDTSNRTRRYHRVVSHNDSLDYDNAYDADNDSNTNSQASVQNNSSSTPVAAATTTGQVARDEGSLQRKRSLRHKIIEQTHMQEQVMHKWNSRCWIKRAWLRGTKQKPEILKCAIVRPVREGERFALDD